MRAANRGDAVVYRRLLEEIAPVLRAMARKRLAGLGLTPDEAEDVVQETLIALHAKRGTWDERRPFLPWLHAIARYKLLDAARRLGRTRRATAAATVDDLAETLAAPAPERDAAGLDAGRLLAALPPRERGVVAALVLEGASVGDTARARRRPVRRARRLPPRPRAAPPPRRARRLDPPGRAGTAVGVRALRRCERVPGDGVAPCGEGSKALTRR